jgi:hypothetical protein
MSQELNRLVGLALACGASDTGGSLTKAETQLAQIAAPASPVEAKRVRAAIRDGGDALGIAFLRATVPA